jgi:hypothetical protein
MSNTDFEALDGLDLSDNKTLSSIDILGANFTAGRKDGQLCVVFKTNGGKGSGPQTVRATELIEFRDTLHECVARGEGSTVEAGYIPAPILLGRSFALVANPGPGRNKKNEVTPAPFGGRDYYEWNSNTGQGTASKGSKPAKVPVDEIDGFLALFDKNVDQTVSRLISLGLMADEDADEDEDEGDEVDLDGIGDED